MREGRLYRPPVRERLAAMFGARNARCSVLGTACWEIDAGGPSVYRGNFRGGG
jgi:hypothetical protein